MSDKVLLKPSTALLPMPVVLVSCQGDEGVPNIITVAYAGVVCGKPPMVSISINPARHSHALVSQSGEFVINIPTSAIAETVDYCGVVSGRDTDKWAGAGLTAVASSQLVAPMIAECPVNIECRVSHTLSLGMHDLFIAEVIAVHADASVLTDGVHVDVARVAPLAFAERHYWTLGEQVGAYGHSVKK